MQRITDCHEFTLWRFEDGSVDLRCHRDLAEVDLRIAYLEANVIARCLGEQIQEQEQLFSVNVYAGGTVSTLWREDYQIPFTWRHFLWSRGRMSSALYDSLIQSPPPPRWMMLCLIGLEYLAAVITRLAKKYPGREQEIDSHAESLGPSQVSGYTGENVIPFPGRQS